MTCRAAAAYKKCRLRYSNRSARRLLYEWATNVFSNITITMTLHADFDTTAPLSRPLGLDQVAILLDVDGTIIDIAPTPREVWVPPTLCRTLSALLKRTGGAFALVSGRSIPDLDLLFAPLHLPMIGGHGAEVRSSPYGAVDRRRAVPLGDELKRRFAAIKSLGRGIIVEDKGYGMALHFRLAPELELAVRDSVAAICADLRPGTVEVLPGKAVIEIKPVGFDKGSAVRELMQRSPFAGRRPIFIGDDKTDEAAFAVLPEFGGLGFSVGRYVAGVKGHFDAPEDVRHWLHGLADSDATIGL
jgi:trehalose 6-phosphate phosphatase